MLRKITFLIVSVRKARCRKIYEIREKITSTYLLTNGEVELLNFVLSICYTNIPSSLKK